MAWWASGGAICQFPSALVGMTPAAYRAKCRLGAGTHATDHAELITRAAAASPAPGIVLDRA